MTAPGYVGVSLLRPTLAGCARIEIGRQGEADDGHVVDDDAFVSFRFCLIAGLLAVYLCTIKSILSLPPYPARGLN